MKFALCVVCLCAIVSSCLTGSQAKGGFPTSGPQGFAELAETACDEAATSAKDGVLELKKYINADFVVVRSWSRELLDGQDDLGFWVSSTEKDLTERAYKLVESKGIGSKGHLSKFKYETQSKDEMIYWVALSIKSGEMHFVEAGGLKSDFANSEKALLKYLKEKF